MLTYIEHKKVVDGKTEITFERIKTSMYDITFRKSGDRLPVIKTCLAWTPLKAMEQLPDDCAEVLEVKKVTGVLTKTKKRTINLENLMYQLSQKFECARK